MPPLRQWHRPETAAVILGWGGTCRLVLPGHSHQLKAADLGDHFTWSIPTSQTSLVGKTSLWALRLSTHLSQQGLSKPAFVLSLPPLPPAMGPPTLDIAHPCQCWALNLVDNNHSCWPEGRAEGRGFPGLKGAGG